MEIKEVRKISSSPSNPTESRTVTGYAAVFESESEDLGFIEVIHKGAITNDTIQRSDILAKFNHDDSKVLARCKHGEGSLHLSVDDKGLRYEFEAPKTALGDELLEYLRRGDIDSSSFAFTVSRSEGSEKWSKRNNGIIYREIYSIDKIWDCSPVFTPAYTETQCSARFSEIKATSEEVDGVMTALKEEVDKL